MSDRVYARVLADSISPAGVRLTTFEVTIPRIVLPEFNTHRAFCLAGDAELEFDLPSQLTSGSRRVYTMSIADFVDKWHNGARRVGTNPRRHIDLDLVKDDVLYTPKELAGLVGFANQMNINAGCRTGVLASSRGDDGRTWQITGRDFKQWRADVPEHSRFGMQDRLRGMRIRQLDEITGKVITSTVTDCCVSGIKRVYEVKAGKYTVAGSQDHRVMTPDGYLPIGELVPGRSQIVVRRLGKLDSEYADPIRLKKIDGRWRSVWQRDVREKLVSSGQSCFECGSSHDLHVHHQIPVHIDPSLAFDEQNVILLCQDCHSEAHRIQGWQGGTYLYGDIVTVDSVAYRGNEQTYDLSIAGQFPNFLANGVVVHNSRNSASSRAIPVEKMLRRVMEDPFTPLYWGKNQKGMQAGEELDEATQAEALNVWLLARNNAMRSTERLLELGVHKQIANRLLEPFMWHTIICTATEWSNFWHLRVNGDAQPEIRIPAEEMYAAMRNIKPQVLIEGEWHLPFIKMEDFSGLDFIIDGEQGRHLARISAARCARVSYLTHDGKLDQVADLGLHNKLLDGGHMSPLEHAAQATSDREWYGNFRGWKSLRYQTPGEADILGYRAIEDGVSV